MPVGSYYGEPPASSACACSPIRLSTKRPRKQWDPERYYTDPSYYNDKNLVRPYRVGMSCGFCHVGPSPINPPADPENPKWENSTRPSARNISGSIASSSGSADASTTSSFQILHTYRPGTLDTSLVSTDNINNPRTMNAIYNLGARLDLARRWGTETLTGGELNNKQFNDYVNSGPLTQFFNRPDTSARRGS